MKDKLEPGNTTKQYATLWALYYHMYIVRDDLNAMIQHLQDLLAASTTLSAWNESSHGTSLKISSESTLADIRMYWQKYLDASDRPERAKRQKVTTAKQFINDQGLPKHVSANRTAGMHGLTHIPGLHAAWKKYWKTGVVAGNQSDVAALDTERHGFVNPLLGVSSLPTRAFIVHHGCDPLLGFHLAQAFDEPVKEKLLPAKLAALAKGQFRNWCQAFKRHLHLRTVQITFHHGDPLNFCYWIQQQTDRGSIMPAYTHAYLNSWTGKTFDIVDCVKSILEYDVIETSELADRCGILNLLPATLPLLSNNAGAVLYTNTFQCVTETTPEYLNKLLHADPITCAVLFDLMPLGLANGILAENFATDIVINQIDASNIINAPYRMRVGWKRPDGGDQSRPVPLAPSSLKVQVAADQLALFFANWHTSLFRQAGTPAGIDFHGTGESRYTQITFVSLLALVHQHVETEWPNCIAIILDRLRAGIARSSKNDLTQELLLLLHMSGLYNDPDLAAPASVTAKKVAASSKQTTLNSLKRFPGVPPVVCVTLVVPRGVFRALPPFSMEAYNMVGLHMVIHNEGTFEHRFDSIHACFGRLATGVAPNAASIVQDPTGWQGSSDVIVMCVAPAFLFLVGRERRTRVALGSSDLSNMNIFASLCHIRPRIFEASVNDGNHVHLSKTLPGIHSTTCVLDSSVPRPRVLHEFASKLTMLNGNAKNLSTRLSETRKAGYDHIRSDGAVTATQHGACSMMLFIGPVCRKLSFPFPIDGSNCKPKISRLPVWVELTVPINCAPKSHGYSLDPFPIVSDRGQLLSWNLGRINLSTCPAISPAVPYKHLEFFIEMAESIQELRCASNPANQRSSPDISKFMRTMALPSCSLELSVSQTTIFKLKRSIQVLFDGVNDRVGRAGQTLNAFTISTTKREEFIILFGSLRHDLQQGSICMEAYVVPLPEVRPPQLTFVLASLKFTGRAVTIQVPEEVGNCWKALLPAMVERCRRDWQHKSTCEYATGEEFVCPRTRPLRQSPICSCGQGEDVGDIPESYSVLSCFATKIVISPLSAVPYIEVMATDMERFELAKVWDKQSAQVIDDETTQPRWLTSCSYCRKPGIDMIQCHLCYKEQWCSKKCERDSREEHKEVCKNYTSFEHGAKAPKDHPTKTTLSFHEHYQQFLVAVHMSEKLNMSLEDYLRAFPPSR
jgi:hypothetical protein